MTILYIIYFMFYFCAHFIIKIDDGF